MNNMQTEFKVEIPEGMEIDRENSTFECIKFKSKSLTYKVIQEAFSYGGGEYHDSIACSCEHVDKLIVYRQLLEVADYFNEGWKPNWNDNNEEKFSIYSERQLGGLNVMAVRTHSYGLPSFKNCEDAQKAIDIIGKENLKILFQ